MKEINEAQRGILIGIDCDFGGFKWLEFAELVKAAGIIEVGRVAQVREKPDSALLIGSGKARELAAEVVATEADLVIAMEGLSPVQVRNLSEMTGVRVIDRTDLVLEIFAQRAQSREGKLQVELARLNYLLPRVGIIDPGQYTRSGGGIGTRGLGETKQEMDRRAIKRRIIAIKEDLKEVEKQRGVQRQLREKNAVPTIALVGYTNAGKSTLFNVLTGSTVAEGDRLFETLDPIASSFQLTSNQEVIFLDTVGFVSDLPHQLVAAFGATLEEAVRSTLQLHVIDASSPELEQQYIAVQKVLQELEIDPATVVNVLNKVDLLESQREVARLAEVWSAFPVSARTGAGLTELCDHLVAKLTATVKRCRFVLPYAEAKLLEAFHQQGQVLETEYTETGIELLVDMDIKYIGKYQNYMETELC